MATNPNNNGQLVGRLAADPVHFVNTDGSKAIRIALYADRVYRTADGQRPSDRIQLEAWVRAETPGLAIWDHVHQGDLIALSFTVRSGSYADKQTGEIVYTQSLRVENVSLLESLKTTSARLAQRLSAGGKAHTRPKLSVVG